MSLLTRRWTAALLGTVLLVGACDDDDDGGNGPNGGDTLSPAEQAVLVDALFDAGIIEGPEAAAILGVALSGEVGQFSVSATAVQRAVNPALSLALEPSGGTYDGVAFQAAISVNGIPDEVVTGMLGWKGINTAAGIVDELILWYFGSEPPGFPSQIAVGIPASAFAVYQEAATGSLYSGVEGSAEIGTPSFGGSSIDCSGVYEGLSVECSFQNGDIDGAFGFVGAIVFGEGTGTIDFPFTTFDLPAVRINADVTVPLQ